jgi:homoserine kinase
LKHITLKAPATIANFGPGFDIFALALEQPYDIIKIQENRSFDISIKIIGGQESLPSAPMKNSAGIAAKAYLKSAGRKAGVDIEIHKRMKSRAGLGTSGASAAAVVFGLNKIFGDRMNADRLIDIARQGEVASGSAAHADNAAGCLMGGFILIKSYSPLKILKINTPAIPLVLCTMKKKHLTTRGNIRPDIPLEKATVQMSGGASLIHAVIKGDIREIGRAVSTDYISEPVRAQDIPGYFELKETVLNAGAYGCNISGGGSTVFAVCLDQLKDRIGQIMQNHIKKFRLDGDVIFTRSSNKGIEEIHGL